MSWDDAFEMFPVLETKRCKLRKIEMTDAPSMYSYFSKDEVTEFYDLATFDTEDEAIDLIESILYRYKGKKQIRWGIVCKETNQFIGSCGFHTLEKNHYKAEIGYELHPDYWGRGIITEVIEAVIHYGFNHMEVNRIEAFYDPLNHGSRRVLEKNGFQYEGVLKQRFYEKGRFVDAAISAIVIEDYLTLNNEE